MSKIYNIGIIGFGYVGQVFHAPIISSVCGLKLHTICDSSEKNLGLAEEKYPDVNRTTTVATLLDDPNIDIVVIGVPNAFHYDLAAQALEKGKHVIVEKPFTINSNDADKLISLAKQQQRLLSVHHNRRWDADFLTAKNVIDSKLLGDLVEYEAHFDQFVPRVNTQVWREKDAPGSGVLFDVGSHLIDQALTLFGLPNAIFCELRRQREQANTTDNFEVILDYDKIKVTLKGGMLVKIPGPHFTLIGNQGSFIKYGIDQQESKLCAGLLPKDLADWGEETQEMHGEFATEINDMKISGKVVSVPGNYRAFYQNIRQTLDGEVELAVMPQQARNTIKVIELAEKSAKEKKWLPYPVE
ncbi:oxidoreductase [Martelella alba]|uniref:Oxidoreductase n=2 Tax=Martelella alba TaxID=2590451 RepID=A0ABY2SE83_9HYPH|nr:oxidoreductase [Martelella alba]